MRAATQEPTQRLRLLKGFVIDDRLSALRREPKIESMVIRRVRLAQPVYIIANSQSKIGLPIFCRVAVTRRTRGWIHRAALALPGRAGEERRILTRVEESSDSVDKISLCRIIIENFGRSTLVPRAMLLLGEEAERVAKTLSQRTRRRLAELHSSEVSQRDYYLSDAGLDRYSRLGIAFDFIESTGEFVYDGKAYREIVRRFPDREEARLARQHLGLAGRKPADNSDNH